MLNGIPYDCFFGDAGIGRKNAEVTSEAQMAAENYLQVIYDNSEAQSLNTYFSADKTYDWGIYDEYVLRKTYVNQEINYYSLVDISGGWYSRTDVKRSRGNGVQLCSLYLCK